MSGLWLIQMNQKVPDDIADNSTFNNVFNLWLQKYVICYEKLAQMTEQNINFILRKM